jgi:hypothetical protein
MRSSQTHNLFHVERQLVHQIATPCFQFCTIFSVFSFSSFYLHFAVFPLALPPLPYCFDVNISTLISLIFVSLSRILSVCVYTFIIYLFICPYVCIPLCHCICPSVSFSASNLRPAQSVLFVLLLCLWLQNVRYCDRELSPVYSICDTDLTRHCLVAVIVGRPRNYGLGKLTDALRVVGNSEFIVLSSYSTSPVNVRTYSCWKEMKRLYVCRLIGLPFKQQHDAMWFILDLTVTPFISSCALPCLKAWYAGWLCYWNKNKAYRHYC